MTSGTEPVPASQQQPMSTSVSPVGRLLHGAIEKPRHHPHAHVTQSHLHHIQPHIHHHHHSHLGHHHLTQSQSHSHLTHLNLQVTNHNPNRSSSSLHTNTHSPRNLPPPTSHAQSQAHADAQSSAQLQRHQTHQHQHQHQHEHQHQHQHQHQQQQQQHRQPSQSQPPTPTQAQQHSQSQSQSQQQLSVNHHHHRRSGKYTHPYGGMRQFAEDRAGTSGWDHECLAIDNLESRKIARSNLADKISEIYKEEFVRVNKAEGKGRPKANNISAAKKTVRMIAERILLSLEAKATQHLFNEVIDKGKESEKELLQLRQIHRCGKDNPNLTYNEIRDMASAKFNGLPDPQSSPAKLEQLPTQHHGHHLLAQHHQQLQLIDTTENDYEVNSMKQALVEMRADQVSRGVNVKMLSKDWVNTVTRACQKLVNESYSRQFVPKTKVYGCRHFTRKNRVLMACCGTFPVCRMCHIQDSNRVHEVQIEPVHTMLCMMCGEVQPKTQNCRKCNVRFGSYYCDVCGITDDTPGYDLRHCNECNVCMPGLTFHCFKCQSCVPATPDHDAVCHGRNTNQTNEPDVNDVIDHSHHHSQSHPHSLPHPQSHPPPHHPHTHAHTHTHLVSAASSRRTDAAAIPSPNHGPGPGTGPGTGTGPGPGSGSGSASVSGSVSGSRSGSASEHDHEHDVGTTTTTGNGTSQVDDVVVGNALVSTVGDDRQTPLFPGL